MNQNLTDINVILDASGSMASTYFDTLGGFNHFLETQKKCEGEALFTLVTFDNYYKVVHNAKSISEVPYLTEKTYHLGGSTALYDAIGRTLNATGNRLGAMAEEDRPAKVVVVIMTDGFENASKEFTQAMVKELITHQQVKYSWEFVFLGANQDAVLTGTGLGINAQASMTYAQTGKGILETFGMTSSKLSSFRHMGEAINYTMEDRTVAMANT